MMALGLIETKGLLPAIEAADAMLKAADVCLLEKNLASGGLVTITIGGEVSAVQASIDAASAAVGRIAGAVLVSRHVIARPDVELEKIIALRLAQKAPTTTPPAPAAPVASTPAQQAAAPMAAPVKQAPSAAPAPRGKKGKK